MYVTQRHDGVYMAGFKILSQYFKSIESRMKFIYFFSSAKLEALS